MEQILEILKELLDEQVIDIKQDKKIRKVLTEYKNRQQKITVEIDEILRNL